MVKCIDKNAELVIAPKRRVDREVVQGIVLVVGVGMEDWREVQGRDPKIFEIGNDFADAGAISAARPAIGRCARIDIPGFVSPPEEIRGYLIEDRRADPIRCM